MNAFKKYCMEHKMLNDNVAEIDFYGIEYSFDAEHGYVFEDFYDPLCGNCPVNRVIIVYRDGTYRRVYRREIEHGPKQIVRDHLCTLFDFD